MDSFTTLSIHSASESTDGPKSYEANVSGGGSGWCVIARRPESDSSVPTDYEWGGNGGGSGWCVIA